MDLLLTRKECRPDGIFSTLTTIDGGKVAETLEHAYPDAAGFSPKIPNGVFKCVRGMHRLHGMAADFETFEITGVAGHSNLLFHWGNYNKDSEGCILLGASTAFESSGDKMVTNSKTTFAKFLEMQKDIDSFMLTVIS